MQIVPLHSITRPDIQGEFVAGVEREVPQELGERLIKNGWAVAAADFVATPPERPAPKPRRVSKEN